MKALLWTTCFFAVLSGLINLVGGIIEVVLYRRLDKFLARKEDLCGGVADILMGVMVLAYVALTMWK